MKSKTNTSWKVPVFALLFAALVVISIGCASADTIYVPEGGNQTIQQAVNNATAGDTVIVRDGTYTENVDVNKRLAIRSENGSVNCIVNASDSGDHVFEVTADCVNISGFTVENATGIYKAGIYLGSGIDHCNISYNNVTNSYYGIHLDQSSKNTLTKNTANSNYRYGIYLKSSSNNNITNNNASNNYYGIHLRSSSNNNLMNNTANSNNGRGIYLYSSSNNTLTKNTANSNNYYGILLSSSSNNTLTNNNASGNTHCGILLSSSSNNKTITNNTANSNNDGIYLDSSSNNTIYNNYFNNTNNALDNGNNKWSILIYPSLHANQNLKRTPFP